MTRGDSGKQYISKRNSRVGAGEEEAAIEEDRRRNNYLHLLTNTLITTYNTYTGW